ncbi:hypothetical protein AMK27_19010 [Streptomyces sp. CB02009]|uniref:DUF6274 family protein n=1 Tax=Streptomyces sp. CB02009 TaxID=1703938 RepID=UPI00093D19E1|nr:DUF6274 family protein [Streptomyces sp. CB02009]OKJ61234.1 hypothetical protein AMK27_19010 [Streptomyces sp. CB02009]
MAAASAARHETRALLRAHLAAASRYGHLTRHCVVCHRLLRLSMDLPEPEGPEEGPEEAEEGLEGAEGGLGGCGGPAGGPVGPADGSGDESPTDP